MTVSTHGDFIVLPHWETRPPEPWPDIPPITLFWPWASNERKTLHNIHEFIDWCKRLHPPVLAYTAYCTRIIYSKMIYTKQVKETAELVQSPWEITHQHKNCTPASCLPEQSRDVTSAARQGALPIFAVKYSVVSHIHCRPVGIRWSSHRWAQRPQSARRHFQLPLGDVYVQ